MNISPSRARSESQIKKLIVPAVVMLAFWGLALWGWLASGYPQPLIMFGYIGTSLGVGLGLYGVKDNRAFCKYVCPVGVLLKLTSRFSLLKIKGDAAKCIGCHACEAQCPMDIRISDYTAAGMRVLSTECVLCQTCITVCTQDALRLSFGFDLGGKDLLRERVA